MKLREAQPWSKHVSSHLRLDSFVKHSIEHERIKKVSVHSRETANALQQCTLGLTDKVHTKDEASSL